MRIATTQISLHRLQHQDDFWTRIESLLKKATNASCQAILLPEYACLSLLTLGYDQKIPFRQRLLDFAHEGYKSFQDQLLRFSSTYDIAMIGGTYPVTVAPGQIVNRCLIARPNAQPLFQDKLNMTRFECEEWQIVAPPQPQLIVFNLDGFRSAVTICYDVEFPRVTEAAASAGVELLLVPSCTEDIHGYWRVRHCAAARAVENQCFVAMASVVSGDPHFTEMDSHYGQAAVLSPCDNNFPERGILAEGIANQEALVIADLNLQDLQHIRKNGTVLNLRDQGQNSAPEVITVN